MASPGGLNFRGLNLHSPINRISAGMTAIAQNIRAYTGGGVTFRNLLTNAIYTLGAAVHSIKRLNDLTPNGPVSGYTLVNGAGTVLYNGSTSIATGFSGNPLSIIPFRPNTSVQPWAYIGDSAAQGAVVLSTEYLGGNSFGPAGTPVNFTTNGMCKVRSDGIIYKSGIKEPQLAPQVSTSNSSVITTGTLAATAIPWTNYPIGTNSSFDYGETEGPPNVTAPIDGTPPFIIDVSNATSVTINALALAGTVVINGTTGPVLTATSSGRVASGAHGYPGQFLQTLGSATPPSVASYVVGAFTDGAGNVLPVGVAPLYIPSVVDVGVYFSTSTPITVPFGAQDFQIGINSEGNTFTQGSPPNYGNINLAVTVTTDAIPAYTAIIGNLTAYYWGDSPNAGPVAQYIWRNPDDPGGSGPSRSTSNANGNTTGNSFIFDCTFGTGASAGIPMLPGVGYENLPMQWTILTPESAVSGSNAVFSAPITTTYPNNPNYDNFNFCLTGNIYFPSAGQYTFVLTSKDDAIWGIGGGVEFVSATAIYDGSSIATALSGQGQTLTVVGGYPLLQRGNYPNAHNNSYTASTVVVSVPAPGIYPIEIDYDYWYSTDPGRILLLMASATPGASPTIIPPLPANVRQEVQYRYVYRSSATGATSNPSPESSAESIPVTANTVTSIWSNDPQVDVVDYYRIDSVTASFTYVNTGPNDNLGTIPGTNTSVTDSLLDTELGTQLLNYDNYEPFPSIDLPQKGVCTVSGGVITWVSGGAIGGSSTGFNPRWLAGTEILIGSPTSLAYTLIARPSPTSVVSGTDSSSTSTGTSIGGGVAWINPTHVDSPTLYTTVSLAVGGTNYSPVTTNGSATVSAYPPANMFPSPVVTNLGTFTTQAATSATLYVTINGSIDASEGGGGVILSYSTNSGVTFTTALSTNVTFSSRVVTIPITGITNLDTVQIQVTAEGACGPTGSANSFINVSNWYAKIGGGSTLSSQTLQAAITGLSAPAGATILGFELSVNSYYSGVTPTLSVNLNVGTEIDNYTLTTSSAGYASGGTNDLWGYTGWTPSTLSSLVVSFNAASTGTTTVYVGALSVTVYYTYLANISTITIPGVPDGSNLAYEIPEPILAAQPLPYMWGPTDNVNFAFAVGDPLRPGTLYWCNASNLDAASDANSIEVTDPAEPLINGAISGGLGVLFSIKRGWMILPNFGSATATATGVTGSTWTLQESSIPRGLYIPRCVCVSGGGNVFFRVDDGIHVSPYGSGSKSITDSDLYPIFPHENSDNAGNQPQPITRNGITIYPPDDTKPQLAKFSYQNGYLYWDYWGVDNAPHTMVFDEAAMGWIWDTYTPPSTIHAANEGSSQQGVLVGCLDGSVRQLTSGGTETITGVVASPAIGGKGYTHCGQIVLEYSSTSTVTLTSYAADEGNGSYGFSPVTLPSTSGVLTKYFFRPSANKYKLLVFQFSSTVPFILNFAGAVALQKSWGSTGAYEPTPIFGGAGGEG
jgi:hypothetical protein